MALYALVLRIYVILNFICMCVMHPLHLTWYNCCGCQVEDGWGGEAGEQTQTGHRGQKSGRILDDCSN